jgi:hypothetical protein
MAGCGRKWCEVCGEELIHRDHRKPWESASALGQIVWREGPLNVTVTDVDLASRKGLANGNQLVWLIEQKQPGHRLRPAQEKILRLLDGCLAHCARCASAADMHIDQRSGLLLVRGHIAASTGPRRETAFDGPQTIEHSRSGKRRILSCHEEFFSILDPEDRTRRNGGGWK